MALEFRSALGAELAGLTYTLHPSCNTSVISCVVGDVSFLRTGPASCHVGLPPTPFFRLSKRDTEIWTQMTLMTYHSRPKLDTIRGSHSLTRTSSAVTRLLRLLSRLDEKDLPPGPGELRRRFQQTVTALHHQHRRHVDTQKSPFPGARTKQPPDSRRTEPHLFRLAWAHSVLEERDNGQTFKDRGEGWDTNGTWQ